MIGLSSLLLEAAGAIIFPLLFILAGIIAERFAKKRIIGLLFAVCGCLLIFTTGGRFFHQWANHRLLEQLSLDEVASIEVNDRPVTGRNDLARLIAALHEVEWFSSNHGGWAQVVPLVIRMKSGPDKRFMVGYYLREEGAVIIFYRGDYSGTYAADGYAFSRGLPQALEGMNMVLPKETFIKRSMSTGGDGASLNMRSHPTAN